MTKKNDYCPPLTTRLEVHLESGICAASNEDVVKDNNTEVTIENQDFSGSFTLNEGGWE